MNEENLNNVPEDGEEFDDDRVVLTDEDGVENEFKFLDVVEVDGKEYVILLPVEKLEDGEVVVFRIEGEGDDETFVGVDSAEEASKVFEIFKERAKDEYNFED